MNEHRTAILHNPTFRFKSVLLLAYLGLAVIRRKLREEGLLDPD